MTAQANQTIHNLGIGNGGGKHSGKKKEPKPKLFGPGIFQWGRGLPRERVGAKKFDMSLETQGIKLFWRDIPGFCRDIPAVPEKFEKKKFVFNFRSLNTVAAINPPIDDTDPIRKFGGGLVFCLLLWLFARQKQHILAILRQKREKGRNKKDDQNWSCFFWSKSAVFPQF